MMEMNEAKRRWKRTKYHVLRLAFIGVFALSGCNIAQTAHPMTTTGENQAAYPSKQATQHGDAVANGVGGVSNLPVFTRFLHNVQDGKRDHCRITSYTDEGDPIFMDLSFDGKVIKYTFDDSNDKFGGSNKGRKTTTCKGISAQQAANGTTYSVTGCQDTNMPSQVLFISSSQR